MAIGVMLLWVGAVAGSNEMNFPARISELRLTGLRSLDERAAIATVGLRVEQSVQVADIEAGMKRLVGTGFFKKRGLRIRLAKRSSACGLQG